MREVYLSQEERLAIQDQVKKPRRKWRRRVLWLLLILPLGVVACILVIGQTSAMQMLIEPILEDQLGIDVSSGSIHLMPTGEIIIRDAVCTTDSIEGLAGSLIEFERATIEMHWWGVLKGSGQVHSILVEKPLVRVSQDIDTGVLNLASMKFKTGGGGGATPAIEIRDGIVQIAEHRGSSYQVLKELSFEGQLSEQTQGGVAGFDFLALPTEPMIVGSITQSRGSIGLSGQISDAGIAGVIDGVRLEDWPAEFVPSRSRGMYDRLGLAGDLAPTKFTVSPDGLVEVVLTLEGVALNLPFDDSGSMTDPIASSDDLLRMRRTRGTIRFGTQGLSGKIKGDLDEIEYDVTLEVQGLDDQSALSATIVTDFRLDEHFKPAQFLPKNVLAKLDRFENPTADVHAVVSIVRLAGANEELRVSGKATLSNGSAIYKKFRYPFHDIAGEIEFDPEQLIVRNVTGVGPTGATMMTNGLFAPLGEQSKATLDLVVQGVNIDEHLLKALDGNSRKLIDALFSEREYSALIKDGVILAPSDVELFGQLRRSVWDQLDQLRDEEETSSRRRELARELASIDRALEAPVFHFRGSADVKVQLVRHPERDPDNRWTTDVHVTLPLAGLISKHFPYPIIARDVQVVFNDDRVELNGGSYRGLSGGEAQVDVLIDLTTENTKPIVNVTARGFPIDQAFIRAIPGYDEPQDSDPDQPSVRRILDRLNLSGMIDCDAVIGPRSDGRLGYDVESTVYQGRAAPSRMVSVPTRGVMDGEAIDALIDPITIEDMYATVYLTEELIIVDLNGMLGSPTQPLAPTRIEMLTQLTLPKKARSSDGAKRVEGLLPDEFGPTLPGPVLYAYAYADGLDLAMQLEHAIAVVSPKLAREAAAYRGIYQPDGVIGVGVGLDGVIGGQVVSTISVDRIDDLGFNHQDTRYWVGSSWGQGEIVWSNEPAMSFNGFRVSIESQDAENPGDRKDAGVLSLDGSLQLVRGGRYFEVTQEESLNIEFKGGTFQSPLVQGVLAQTMSGDDDREPWHIKHQVEGRFDLQMNLAPVLGMHYSKPGSGKPNAIKMLPTEMTGALMPRSISLRMGEERAQFRDVSGRVVFDGFGGEIESIRMVDQGTSVLINGPWTAEPGNGLGFGLTVEAGGDLLAGPVRAIMPEPIDRVIDRLQIKSSGEVKLNELQLVASALGTEDEIWDITGSVGLMNGSALIGLPITGLAGDLSFAVHGTNNTLGYEIDIFASRLRAGRMRIYDARVSIIGDANNNSVVLIPEIRAGMHGGQIAGSAQILPNSNDELEYWLEVHASGVRAAPVFDDLLLPPEGLVGPPRPGHDSVLSSWSLGEDLSRGAMIADLTLTGPIGDPSKRSGRGLVQIEGGSVVSIPGFLPLIEASNFSLPASSPLDLAQASFYVDGETMAVEQLNISSELIEILGYGTIDWSTRGVDLRFRSRAVHPIPVFSRIFEQIRDELITMRVTGVLGDLQTSVRQFDSTRRLVDALLGKPVTDQQRKLREVEDQVKAHRGRSRQARKDVVHLPTDAPVDEDDWE